jgi:uncharacterized membrane protein YecN with MAPEG domain
MLSESNGRRINIGIDITSFIAVCSVLMSIGKADPGDIIFVFVYESTIMVIVFLLFFILFNTFEFAKENKHLFILKSIFKGFSLSLIAACSMLLVSFFFILLLNQITVELLVGFLKENEFQFKSIEVLSSSGVYLESETMLRLEALFGKSYSMVFYILGIKYFANLLVNYFSTKKTSKSTFAFVGLYETASQIIISPIVMFISCVILVILAEIFGPQTWIVFLCLAIFRLLFLYSFSKISKLLKSI